MKFSSVAISALSLSSAVTAAVIPEEANSLVVRPDVDSSSWPEAHTLEKRKGGGGGGRGGGSSGGSRGGSSSSGSSGSSGSGGTSGSGGRSGSSGSGGSAGGRGSTSSTTGVTPNYGGGRYYSGGATAPYAAGRSSPRGVAPYLVGGAALGLGAGALLYGAYLYPYHNPYSFYNRTANQNNNNQNNGTNTTLPVSCFCDQYSACGCEDQTDQAYLDSIVGNGSASALNSTVARITNINGTQTLVINGTLPNGTTDGSSSSSSTSAGGSLKQGLTEKSGWLAIAAGVGYTVWLM